MRFGIGFITGIFTGKGRRRRAANVRNNPQNAPRRGGLRSLPRWAVAALVVAPSIAAVCAGVWAHYHFYLCRDSRYALDRWDIEGGPIYSASDLAEFLQLEKGGNIFKVCDIAEKRALLLKNGFAVKEVSITRHLPGRLVVKAVEREPVARIAGEPRLLVDDEGVVFAGNWPLPLPKIFGAKEAKIEAGTRLRGMGLKAAVFARALRTSGHNMPVEKIDASQVDFIIAHLQGGQTVRIAEHDIGPCDTEGPHSRHLAKVAGLVNQTPAGRVFDARDKSNIIVQ